MVNLRGYLVFFQEVWPFRDAGQNFDSKLFRLNNYFDIGFWCVN